MAASRFSKLGELAVSVELQQDEFLQGYITKEDFVKNAARLIVADLEEKIERGENLDFPEAISKVLNKLEPDSRKKAILERDIMYEVSVLLARELFGLKLEKALKTSVITVVERLRKKYQNVMGDDQ